MDSREVSDFKRELREQANAAREVAWRANPLAGEALKQHLTEALSVPPGIAVSGYWPLQGEIDVRPALKKYHREGHPVGLPVVIGKSEPLLFRRWNPAEELVMGRFKVLTPPEGSDEIRPRVLLVPMLAFDPDGYRLGYGGGFYDRTLAKLRSAGHAVAVGVAYAAQEMPFVPRGPYDQPLDLVVTEHSVFKFDAKK
jgi:5-formyltetrahydrofolate cyclo-ligase